MDAGRSLAQGGLMQAQGALMQAQGALMRADGDDPSQARFSRAVPGRSRAFRSAARHSARVKWLRRLILGGAALLSVGVVWFSYFRTIDVGDAHFSLSSIGISGDKVTMEHPKLTGVRRDGRPYEVTADTGVQNPHNPNRTDLTRLDARLHLSDDGETRVLGDHGLYDSVTQSLDLSGNVRIKGVNFDLTMQTASMNFKTSALSSKDPVRLTFDGGWVSSNKMTMADNGAQITFIGNVQSQFKQAADNGAATALRNDN